MNSSSQRESIVMSNCLMCLCHLLREMVILESTETENISKEKISVRETVIVIWLHESFRPKITPASEYIFSIFMIERQYCSTLKTLSPIYILCSSHIFHYTEDCRCKEEYLTNRTSILSSILVYTSWWKENSSNIEVKSPFVTSW